MDLAGLLELILQETPDYDFRIRLSSIEPLRELNDKIINLIKDSSKICRHLHIPLQSGSDKVLKDMNRRYTQQRI